MDSVKTVALVAPVNRICLFTESQFDSISFERSIWNYHGSFPETARVPIQNSNTG